MWGSERQSGLLNTLNLSQSSGVDPGRTTCFCEFCQKKGRELGLDAERARRGFGEIEKFVRASRAGQRPRDGFFTATWRLLLAYPEVLAWANLWVSSRHDLQAAIYRKVKSINPALPVGWHVWQNMSFSPFQRAEEDFAAMTPHADFLRPALYNNSTSYIVWAVLMAASILFSQLLGIMRGEWTGTCGKTRGLLASGLVLLIVSVAVAGYAGSL